VNEVTVPRRLTRFSIEGLFGEFNHNIPLHSDDHVTALIGPNGMGKTACLKLIDSLFHNQWSTFQSTEFRSIIFEFDDESTIFVNKEIETDGDTDVSDTLGVQFVTTFNNGSETTTETWVPRSYENFATKVGSLERHLPFLTRLGPKSYMHDATGKIMSVQEIIESYGDRLPVSVKRSVADEPVGHLAKITSQIDCHLIETQRLLVFSDDYRRSGHSGSTLAISRKAQVLREIIAKELADYAATSQSLDRTFPIRVLQHGSVLPPEDLRANLAALDVTRKGLTDAGILDSAGDDVLPSIDQINNELAAVLNVYVRDTQTKLGVLAKIKDRIQLFIELINDRFYPKIVTVDKNNGISVTRDVSHVVPLEKLSSGEQHQLVLFFELLFELKSNALILIDEPELSLHVTWQKQFIPDLKRIIDLNDFNVLLATHSPQLIGEWDEIVVELGEVDI